MAVMSCIDGLSRSAFAQARWILGVEGNEDVRRERYVQEFWQMPKVQGESERAAKRTKTWTGYRDVPRPEYFFEDDL